MPIRKRLSEETKRLFRAYALHVARKNHPDAVIDVEVGNYVDENGRVERTVTIVSEEH